MTVAVYAPVGVRFDPLRDSRHREARAARDMADWLAWLELGNTASRTLDTYERYAAALLRAFPDKAFDEFTDGDLAHALRQHPPLSRHIVKAALNNWFKWGYRTRRIPGNPVDLLPPIRYKPNRVYDVFADAEVEAMCGLPTPDGELNTILFWTGIRRTEARLLTGRRLNLDRQQVIVVEGAKGSKPRQVAMVERVRIAAAQLLLLEGINDSDYVWATRPGGGRLVRRDKPIGNSSFDRWWQRCLDEAGVRHRNPHMARHTLATRLYKLGMKDKEIQRILGHESSQTTQDTYIHVQDVAVDDRFRELVGDA